MLLIIILRNRTSSFPLSSSAPYPVFHHLPPHVLITSSSVDFPCRTAMLINTSLYFLSFTLFLSLPQALLRLCDNFIIRYFPLTATSTTCCQSLIPLFSRFILLFLLIQNVSFHRLHLVVLVLTLYFLPAYYKIAFSHFCTNVHLPWRFYSDSLTADSYLG